MLSARWGFGLERPGGNARVGPRCRLHAQRFVDEGAQRVVVTARRAIAADEELLNCYGELDDAKFLTRFGFVPGKANGEYIASLQKGKLPFGFKLY